MCSKGEVVKKKETKLMIYLNNNLYSGLFDT
jgi:hypothetical protein